MEPLPWAPPASLPVLQMVCEQPDVFASACALARAFPLFSHRSGASRRTEKRTVTVEFFLVGQDNGPVELSTLQVGVWRCIPCPWAPRSSGGELPLCPGPRAAAIPGSPQRAATGESNMGVTVFRILF